MRILLMENEKRLSSSMRDILIPAKYFIDIVPNGEAGMDYARSDIYDCLILDATAQGIATLNTLRQERIDTPVLMLTPRNTPHSEALGGLSAYLNKPFLKEELLTGIRELLRNLEDFAQDQLGYGDIHIDFNTHTIHCQENNMSLSAREFELARLLLLSQEEVVPKETIFLKIWGYDSEAESNVVEAYVSFLRRKLRKLDSQLQLVAVRRKGYRLVHSEPEPEPPTPLP